MVQCPRAYQAYAIKELINMKMNATKSLDQRQLIMMPRRGIKQIDRRDRRAVKS